MKRRKIMQSAALSAGCLISPHLLGKGKPGAARSPNIVFIVLDELGYFEWIGKSKGFKGHREK